MQWRHACTSVARGRRATCRCWLQDFQENTRLRCACKLSDAQATRGCGTPLPGMRHAAPAARSVVKDTEKNIAGTAAEMQQPLRTCTLTLARFSTFLIAGGRH